MLQLEEMPIGPVAMLTWPEAGASPAEHPAITAGRAILDEKLLEGEPETLEGWRDVIGDLDFALVSIMAARMQATGRLSPVKAQQQLPSVDLKQEGVVFNRAADAATEMGIDSSAVTGLMKALIDAARQQHNTARSSTVQA